MRMTDNIFRVAVFPKKDESFRLQGQKDRQFHYLTVPQFVVGSSKEAAITVGGPGVGEYHLSVTVKEREIWVQNVGTNDKTLVSGRALDPQEVFHYKSGEVIQLGQSETLLVVELFSRHLDPMTESARIVKEAEEKAAKIDQQSKQVKKETAALLASAEQQIEEKNRQALEDNHARAENMVKDLLVSAKKEVDAIIKQAHGKAVGITEEAEEKKKEALQFIHDLQTEMSKLIEDKTRFEGETRQSQQVCEEAVKEKEKFVKLAEESEKELTTAREKFYSFKNEIKKTEEEHEAKLKIFTEKYTELEAQMRKSQHFQKEAEKETADLKAQASELERQIGASGVQHKQALALIKDSESAKAKCLSEIAELKENYKKDLVKLREKVDAEYKRQLQEQDNHFKKVREHENFIIQHRQANQERMESRSLRRQITQTQEQLQKMISDRAALFGIEDLGSNAQFKNDLNVLVFKTMTEEFELRRRENVLVLPSPEALQKKKKLTYQLTTFGGWLLFICMLSFLIYGQVSTNAQQPRQPASKQDH